MIGVSCSSLKRFKSKRSRATVNGIHTSGKTIASASLAVSGFASSSTEGSVSASLTVRSSNTVGEIVNTSPFIFIAVEKRCQSILFPRISREISSKFTRLRVIGNGVEIEVNGAVGSASSSAGGGSSVKAKSSPCRVSSSTQT